ncbi:MAG: hypothetical protein ACFFCI_21565 [Promethearchaeota archaeon]
MPKAIVLFEIDQSFGPNVLAEYYLKQDEKIPPNILKEFSEKHVKKGYPDVNIRDENNRYYSNMVNTESIEKENLYLAFILQEEEDLLSVQSAFKNIEETVLQNFSNDKKRMTETLKEGLNSVMSMIEKLKEPKIIKDILNERTKKMLDDGLLQEARELIDIGEEIPEKLAEEVKIAEQFLEGKEFRKAKKSFLKASELASVIQEEAISSFLVNKGEKVGLFPELLKEHENLNREIQKVITELDSNKLYLFEMLNDPIDRLIEISNNFEESEQSNDLTKAKNNIQRASRLAKELEGLKNKIKENFSKY